MNYYKIKLEKIFGISIVTEKKDAFHVYNCVYKDDKLVGKFHTLLAVEAFFKGKYDNRIKELEA